MNQHGSSSPEESMVECGYKMMGASINGNASGSNPLEVGSNPTPPATQNDKYHAAGLAAMDAYGNACIDVGRFPTQQGLLDAAVEGMATAMTRDMVRDVVGKMLDTYIDDATGA